MAGFGPSPQYPFMYPGVYSPGQVAFNNNPEMSQLISMFSGPLLGQMAGPGSFLPHMMPSQQMTDQFAMRNYQDQSRAAAFGVANDNTANVAARFMGIRSAFTNAAPTELNREQAANMASIANNPFAKAALGMIAGPENVEAMFHGSKGDISALQNQVSRIGYFRQDPSGGGGRMDAESLMSFSRGMYANMYEPQGNLEEIEKESRSTDERVRASGRKRLKQAAKREDATIVEDDELVSRFENMENAQERVGALYKKYVQGGTATDTKQQAQELVKLDRAVQASGQLKENEATIGGLVNRAERVPVNEMRGFMAGQVGQITENMFQRGLLPQAVGAMSAADRARAINQTPLDEETTKRLSREMARRDFEDKNNASDEARTYRGLTTERERDEFVKQNSGKYEQTLENTRKEIEKTATGAAGAMSAGDLDKLQGFDSLASNVDAKRSTEAIKKYTGAVAAIRDIFGDNGNPNAPLPALLAALEGLTGGAVGSMKPQKIEATLRQMQTAAKEAGIGFEQMAAMSTQMDGMSQALGLTPADSMRLKAGTMSAVKVMQDTGAFSNQQYGQVDKGTATQRVGELIARGAASRTSKAMASLESIYQADPDRFKGTELEKALEAYRNNEGDGTYEFGGEKKNIREMMGRLGPAGAEHLLTQSGGRREEFIAQLNNPNAMKFSNEMFGFLAQKHEARRDINYGDTQFRVHNKLKDKTTLFQGLDHRGRNDLSAKIGDVMARMVVDTSGMDSADQITKIQKDLEGELKKEFEKTMPPAEAEAKAKEAAAAMSSRGDINEFIGGANSVYAARTGGRQLSEDFQYRGEGRDAKTAAENSRQAKRAERRSATAMGHEGTMMGRASDYLLDIGINNEKFNPDEFLKAMGNVTTDNEVLRNYATNELKGGFDALGTLRKDAFVTNSEVDSLKARAKEGNLAAIDELRKLGGLAEKDDKGNYKTQIVDQKAAEKLRDEQIAKSTTSGADLLAQYKKYGGSTSSTAEQLDKSPSERATMINELRNNKQFMADMQRQGLGDNRVSMDEAAQKAENAVGTAKAGQENLARDTDKIQAAMLYGNNEDVRRTGVFAAFRAIDQHTKGGLKLSEEQQNAIMTAVSDTGDGGKKKLEQALSSIKDPEARKMAGQLFGAIQSGIPIAVGDTLGIDKVPDRELEKQLKTQLEERGLGDQAAKDVKARVDKQREEDKKAGAPKTDAEAKAAELKRVETALTDEYKKTMAPDKAAAQAKADAAGVMAKAESAAKEAGGVAQKVNTLEVSAQTVIIKSGKVESSAGDKPTGGSSSPSSGAGAKKDAELPTNAADVNKEMDGIVQRMKKPGMLGKLFGSNKLSFANKEDEERYHALQKRKQEIAAAEGKTPDEAPKADESVKESVPAPAAPAAEPDKVQQANDEQLKHNTGNATNEPAVAKETPAQETPAVDQKQRDALIAAKEAREKNNKLYSNLSDKDKMATERAVDHYGELISLGGTDFEKYKEEIKNYKGNNNDFSEEARAAALAEIDMRQKEHENKQARNGDKQYQADVKQYGAAEAQKMYNKRVSEAPTEKEVADANAPASMSSLIDAVKASPAGQAVLQGATALYEKFAPEAVKDAVANKQVADTPANDRQMQLQEQYVHWQKKFKEATNDTDRKEAQSGIDRALNRLGEHNAAQAAGVDTGKGIRRDEHAQTINGKEVKNAEVERHVRLLKEKTAKDPNSILSDSIKERHGFSTPNKEAVKAKNEAELQKNAGGVSSANVAPGDAAATAQKPAGEEFNNTSWQVNKHSPRASSDVVASEALSQTISETAPQAGGGVSAANRVHAMSADTVMSGAAGSTASAAAGASAQSGSMTINGTLTLSGLQEAIISAQGAQVMQTEGGAPVVIDPAMTPRAAAAPRTV